MEQKKSPSKRFWKDWSITRKLISIISLVTVISIFALLVVNYFMSVKQNNSTVGQNLVVLGNEVIVRAAEQVMGEVAVLETLAKTTLLVEAVTAANVERRAWTEGEIASMDQDWIDEKSSMDDIEQEILSSESTKYLVAFLEDHPQQVEIFVTDVKGLNIAMTDRTSDFRQSDEGWWESAYAGGSGTHMSQRSSLMKFECLRDEYRCAYLRSTFQQGGWSSGAHTGCLFTDPDLGNG